MAKRKIQVKKIKNIDDLKKLEIGDIVEVNYYGRMIYYATSMVSRTFLGRDKLEDSIRELEVVRGHVVPSIRNGSINIGVILSEVNYHRDPNHNDPNGVNGIYKSKDALLIGAGI